MATTRPRKRQIRAENVRTGDVFVNPFRNGSAQPVTDVVRPRSGEIVLRHGTQGSTTISTGRALVTVKRTGQ